MDTPILFLIFNRPASTLRVFNEIRKAQPRELFIAADGPRNNTEKKFCDKAREIAESIDWNCKVSKSYRDSNLGCKVAVSSAIDWFFSNVEQGIILEDDCLPHQSFFPYCEELLERYKDNPDVMMISGDNFQFGRERLDPSYYFSGYPHIWGWATWERAWDNYDIEMKQWPFVRRGFQYPLMARAFDKVYSGKLDTWDYQWSFACMVNNGLSVTPAINLVSNIGFCSGTHTTSDNILAELPRYEMAFPLTHPNDVLRNTDADKFEESIMFTKLDRLASWFV